MEEFLFVCMFLLACLFVAALVGLINSSPSKKKGDWLKIIVDPKASLIIFGISFLLFLVYFAGTAQLLQLEQTISFGTETFVIANNNYLFFYALLPVVQGLFAMTAMLCVGTIFRTFELSGRGRMV